MAVIRLKFLCSSFSTPLTQDEIKEEGLFPVFGASGLVGYSDVHYCSKPYLGIIKDGAGVGRISQYPEKSSLLGTMAYIVPTTKVSISWLRYAIISLELGKDVSSTTIPHIYFKDYGNRFIPDISIDKQCCIAEFLDRRCAEIDHTMEQTRVTIEEYKKLKQSIITEAVTHGVRGPRKMKDSGAGWLGMIPEIWSVYRIANIYEERNESGSDDLPILLVSINTGISDHEVSDDERTRAFVRIEDRSKYKRVYPGDLAYNMMRAWQGAFGAVRVDGMVSPAYVVAKPKGNILIDSRYMEALLRSPSAIEEMHRFSHGITDFRLRLYWPEFKAIRICIPPYEEQVEIADFIDLKSSEIDRLINSKQQLLTELEAYKKSVIYEYVTGKREVPQ